MVDLCILKTHMSILRRMTYLISAACHWIPMSLHARVLRSFNIRSFLNSYVYCRERMFFRLNYLNQRLFAVCSLTRITEQEHCKRGIPPTSFFDPGKKVLERTTTIWEG